MAISFLPKSTVRIIRQLLSLVSSDAARPILSCIKVNKEQQVAMSANGFMLEIMNITNVEELNQLETGTYAVKTGSLERKPVVLIEPFEGRTPYPDLSKILRLEEDKPSVEFAVNAKFLLTILRETKGSVIFRIFANEENKVLTPIELNFKVEGTPVHGAIMPTIMADKPWSASKIINPSQTRKAE